MLHDVTPNDYLIGYGDGGYNFPDKFASAQQDRAKWLDLHDQRMAAAYKQSGLNSVVHISKQFRGAAADEYFGHLAKNNSRFVGQMSVQYVPYALGTGEVRWFPDANGDDMPLGSYRYSWWNKPIKGNSVQHPHSTVDLIKQNAKHDGPVQSEDYFSAIMICCWDRLRNNPAEERVTSTSWSTTFPYGTRSWRQNCGGESFVDAAQQEWGSERRFEAHNRLCLRDWGSYGEVLAKSTADPKPMFLNHDLYKNWAEVGNGSGYRYLIGKGRYKVSLHFCEMEAKEKGVRVFDVAINGQTRLKDLDLVAVSGFGQPVCYEYEIYSPNEILEISFPRAQKGKAMISGIEIEPLDPAIARGYQPAVWATERLPEWVRTVTLEEYLMQMRLRLRTEQTLARYQRHLENGLAQTEGWPVLGQGQQLFESARAHLADSRKRSGREAYEACQAAETALERGRLHCLKFENEGDGVIGLRTPAPMPPLYYWGTAELDPEASTVRQYQVQTASDPEFKQIMSDYIAPTRRVRVEPTAHVRVQAIGWIENDRSDWLVIR
jgi:hypothetical protein